LGTYQEDVYAQRINSSGNILWTTDGKEICTESNSQLNPRICSDGAGGAIITWADERGGTYYDVYAQRVSSSGDVQWMTNGVEICTASGDQGRSELCSDGIGGAIITWMDERSGWASDDIYAQRVNSSGDIQWMTNGVEICTADNSQIWPQICSDGASGGIITWWDDRTGDHDIYVQAINSSGIVKWSDNGTAICTESNNQEMPQICTNGAGGAIIAWSDFRNGVDYDVYAQNINSFGQVQWTANGTAICTANFDQATPLFERGSRICSDGAGGAIIIWDDFRGGTYNDIYAQIIDSSGIIRKEANGTAICTSSNYQSDPQICSDGAGGAIITWTDRRGGTYTDIYAQLIKGWEPPPSNALLTWILLGITLLISSSPIFFIKKVKPIKPPKKYTIISEGFKSSLEIKFLKEEEKIGIWNVKFTPHGTADLSIFKPLNVKKQSQIAIVNSYITVLEHIPVVNNLYRY